MTILVLWQVLSGCEVERHTLDNVSDEDALDILWHKRDELNAHFYNMDTTSWEDQTPFLNASEFEDDYNNEDYDGGHWCKVLHIDQEDIKTITED